MHTSRLQTKLRYPVSRNFRNYYIDFTFFDTHLGHLQQCLGFRLVHLLSKALNLDEKFRPVRSTLQGGIASHSMTLPTEGVGLRASCSDLCIEFG